MEALSDAEKQAREAAEAAAEKVAAEQAERRVQNLVYASGCCSSPNEPNENWRRAHPTTEKQRRKHKYELIRIELLGANGPDIVAAREQTHAKVLASLASEGRPAVQRQMFRVAVSSLFLRRLRLSTLLRLADNACRQCRALPALLTTLCVHRRWTRPGRICCCGVRSQTRPLPHTPGQRASRARTMGAWWKGMSEP